MMNYLYPILYPIGILALLFVPGLVLCAIVPRRFPAVRHAILASTFVAIAAIWLAAPLLKSTGAARSPQAPKRAEALMAARLDTATGVSAASAPAERGEIEMPPSLHPRYEFADSFFAAVRAICFGWLALSYLLALLILARSRPSKRYPGIRVSPSCRIPLSLWALRPYILAPMEAEEWDRDRLARVVAHESAHIERRDWFCQTIGNVVLAYSVLNPLAWIAFRKMRYEAECAADQRVLGVNASPSDYASDLLAIAKSASRAVNCAILPMGGRHSLAKRVKAILAEASPRQPKRGMALVTACIAFALCGACALLVVPAIAGAIHLPVATNVLIVLPNQIEAYAGMESSHSPDIRNGLTKPGRASDGWTATFSNGAQIKLVGIYWGTKAGYEFRDPDGNPAKAPEPAGWVTGHPGRLDLLFTASAADFPEGLGVGIGTPSGGEVANGGPTSVTYFGGSDYTSPDRSQTYMHDFYQIVDPYSNDFGASQGSKRLAAHFSLGVSYGKETGEVKAAPLAALLSGKSYQLDKGILSLGHRTNAEKVCLRQLPEDDFGIRLETPVDLPVTYSLALSDRADGAAFNGALACGGQEDGRPGYNCTQNWFPKRDLHKKFVVAKAYRSYDVDFIGIPIPDGLGH